VFLPPKFTPSPCNYPTKIPLHTHFHGKYVD
jgi:hypothetical protein